MAASAALPPLRNMRSPASLASGCDDATIPRRPKTGLRCVSLRWSPHEGVFDAKATSAAVAQAMMRRQL
jgi:hypothetical protein